MLLDDTPTVPGVPLVHGVAWDAAALSWFTALSGGLPHRVFVKDCQSRYLHANRSYAETLGVLPEELLGTDDFAWFPAELAELYRAGDVSVIDRGEPTTVVEPIVLQGMRRWIRTTKVPVRDTSGEVTAVVGIFEDISEMEEARQQADFQLHRAEALWQQNRDAVFMADADTGELLDLNPAAEVLAGRPRAELVGQHQSVLHLAEPTAEVMPEFTRSTHFLSDRVYLDVRRPSGELVPVEITASARIGFGARDVVFGVFRDLTDDKRRDRELQHLNWTLQTLLRCNAGLGRVRSEQEAYHEVCRNLTVAGAYPLAWVGIPQQDAEQSLLPVAVHGSAVGYLDGMVVSWGTGPMGQGPGGRAYRTKTTQVLNRSQEQADYAPWHERARLHNLASVIVLPIASAQGDIGVLAVYGQHPDTFGTQEVELLEQLAKDLAFAVDDLRLREQLEQSVLERQRQSDRLETVFERAITAIAATVERRDPYTAGHEQRVAKLSVAIGSKMGMTDKQLQGLRLAALVHDLGKIQIPFEILNKPGALTRLEYQLVQGHAEAGYEILRGLEFPWPLADIVRQHHERLDGSGYPQGLRGEEILIEAKVLAVADVVESMSSHRPYRASLGTEAALQELEQQWGTRLDPDVVDACVALFRHDGFCL
jgi:PAS domain S-box-containing protein/putative nucleotidyltransferase with HDIG domain